MGGIKPARRYRGGSLEAAERNEKDMQDQYVDEKEKPVRIGTRKPKQQPNQSSK